jgi:hypothetical protein
LLQFLPSLDLFPPSWHTKQIPIILFLLVGIWRRKKLCYRAWLKLLFTSFHELIPWWCHSPFIGFQIFPFFAKVKRENLIKEWHDENVSTPVNFNFGCVVESVHKTMLIRTKLHRKKHQQRERCARKAYFMVNKTSKIGSISAGLNICCRFFKSTFLYAIFTLMFLVRIFENVLKWWKHEQKKTVSRFFWQFT